MLKTIMCCCGNGLGSSFMLELNVKKALKLLKLNDVIVKHTALGELTGESFDLIMCAQDLVSECQQYGTAIGLENLMSIDEITEKIKPYIK